MCVLKPRTIALSMLFSAVTMMRRHPKKIFPMNPMKILDCLTSLKATQL
jgi:hypothetical protein